MQYTPVCLVVTSIPGGTRRHVAYTKSGQKVFDKTTSDSGHGSHVAMVCLRSDGYEPTQAEWAFKMRREKESKS